MGITIGAKIPETRSRPDTGYFVKLRVGLRRSMIQPHIIIGAGLSGLVAASVLRRAGKDVVVLEKSRGLGGRAATRRWDGLPVDHGAQFFTARSGGFREQVDAWLAGNICHRWSEGFHQYRHGALQRPESGGFPRYACREGMSALGKAMARDSGTEVACQAKVAAIRADGGSWIVSCEDGRSFRGCSLTVTAPPPQGALLLAESAPAPAELLRGISMDPCIALVARFSRRDIVWQGIQSDDPSISWIGHDSSKRPDLHAGETILVIHASPKFSREFYDKHEDVVLAALLARASEISGSDLRSPRATFIQRWRYAQPVAAREGDAAILFDQPAPLVLAGECFAGGKMEGAWLSGAAAGEALVGI